MFIINRKEDIPKGFRKLTDDEIAKDFFNFDKDKNYFITKNEWILNFLKIYNLEYLEKEGPDSIMDKIEELSNQFDKYDKDHNKVIDFIEYKNFINDYLLISEE